MNAERYILTGVIALCLVAYILLTVIDRRTPINLPTAPTVRFLMPDDPDPDELEMFMLAAIARGDKALADYVEDRDGQHLINGLLDMRNRLAQGLDLEPDELAERLDDERQSSDHRN